MDKENKNFDIVLSDAKKLGYAESNPLADLNGDDVASKLKILTSLCFNSFINNNIYVEGIKEIEKIYQYELPENLVGIIWKGKYRGQKQKWFITRFLGQESEINLNTKNAEFIDWKWIEPKLLHKVIVNFKKDLYLNLLTEINLVIC